MLKLWHDFDTQGVPGVNYNVNSQRLSENASLATEIKSFYFIYLFFTDFISINIFDLLDCHAVKRGDNNDVWKMQLLSNSGPPWMSIIDTLHGD